MKAEKKKAKRAPKGPHPLDNIPTAMRSLFMDSGAHALYNIKVLNTKKGVVWGRGDFSYYDLTPGSEFREYLAKYAAFIKEHGWAMDFYATVDAISNPELTWKIQKFLEKEHGLKPVPVIHYGADMAWIERYLDDGYTFLGIGGLGQGVGKEEYFKWGDRLFSLLCSGPDRLPCAKTHGFAMTAWDLLVRYPWWSVDSASWIKAAAFGQIYVPRLVKGEFSFDHPPYSLTVSEKSPNRKEAGKHLLTLSPAARRAVCAWLEYCGVALGTETQGEQAGEFGALTHHKPRALVNLRYFKALADSRPKWPYPLDLDRVNPMAVNYQKGFGLL